MKKAAAGLTLAFVAGIAAYLVWAYPRLPTPMPLVYSLSSVPLGFGSRDAFVGISAAAAGLFFASFLAAAKAWPRAAWVATLALALVLFFVHVRVQAVLAAFLPVPENLAVTLAAAAMVLSVVWAVFLRRPPPPRRVKPF